MSERICVQSVAGGGLDCAGWPSSAGGPAGHLRQVLQQRLLRLRRVLLALDDAAVVAQLLDLVLDTLALGLQLLLIGARDVAAARIDRLDVEAGGRLAVDADGAGHGLGRQVAEDERVLALLQRQPRGARRFRPGGENGDRLDARGDRNLVGQCMSGEDDQKQTRQCDDRAHGAAHPSYFPGRGRPSLGETSGGGSRLNYDGLQRTSGAIGDGRQSAPARACA